jgi:uncharacterized phage infection (PIP) family protein YhgE|tara:strand:+ start:319 stop:696 length:378 start_codon:yes stop_codon:yes gene_type:complete
MANMKRLEKRLENVEQWAKALEKGAGPAQTMENMNWLVGQTRILGDRMAETEQGLQQMQAAMSANNEILQQFLDKHDMIRDWQVYLEELQQQTKENDDAVQEQETEEVSSRDEAEDGEEVGKEDA